MRKNDIRTSSISDINFKVMHTYGVMQGFLFLSFKYVFRINLKKIFNSVSGTGKSCAKLWQFSFDGDQ